MTLSQRKFFMDLLKGKKKKETKPSGIYVFSSLSSQNSPCWRLYSALSEKESMEMKLLTIFF